MFLHKPLKYWWLFIALALLLGLTGCSKTKAPVLTTISITPSSARVVTGGTMKFTATAKDQKGKEMTGVTFTWTVDPEGIGEISKDGVFTGKKAGNCRVICAAKGKTASAEVEVYEPSLAVFAEQIVKDTQRVVGDIGSLAENRTVEVMTKMEEQLLPYLPQAEMAMKISTSVFELLPALIYLKPGDYDWDDVIEPEELGDKEPKTGSWKVTREEEFQWTYYNITHRADGDTDEIKFTITSTNDPKLRYEGTATYLTDLLGEEEKDRITFEIDVTMEDSVLAPSSFLKGRIDVPAEEPVPFDFPVITTDVEAYFQFWQSDDYLRLYDVISLQFGRNAEDLLTGTLETMDLKLTGDLAVSYVENEHVPIEVLPSKISLNGGVQIKNERFLEGELLLEVGNAATYYPLAEYSETNWPKGKITFRGEIWGDPENGMAVELSVEETACFEYNVRIAFELYDNGIPRELNISLNNTGETIINLEVNSTWGPARIAMQIIFDNGIEEAPTDIKGTVEVDGVQVGTISLTTQGLMITYIDGTYETL